MPRGQLLLSPAVTVAATNYTNKIGFVGNNETSYNLTYWQTEQTIAAGATNLSTYTFLTAGVI